MQQEPLIDVKNLCSRKLWEILKIGHQQKSSRFQQARIEKELLTRQHYLQEISSLPQQH